MPRPAPDSPRSPRRSDPRAWLLLVVLLLAAGRAVWPEAAVASSRSGGPLALERSLCQQGEPCGTATLPVPMARHLRRRDAVVDDGATLLQSLGGEGEGPARESPVLRLRDRPGPGLGPRTTSVHSSVAAAAGRFTPHRTDIPPPRAA